MAKLTVIEKCKKGEDLTWGEYCEGANRTLSGHFFGGDDYPFSLALEKINAFIKAGEALDQLKKALFYGRGLELANEEYQIKVRLGLQEKTVWPAHIDPKVIHAILGIATESVELVEALMEALLNEVPLDAINMMEELGDLFWYVAIFFNIGFFNQDLQPIMRKNLLKLYARYPDKFNKLQAVERDLETERATLETVN